MKGDILFFHDPGFYNSLVQWGTHGPFNHVAIDIGDGMMVEAIATGVKRGPLRELHATRYACGNRLPDLDLAVVWLLTQLNYSYDWYDIFLACIFRLYPRIANEVPYIPDDHYICSELAAWFLRKAGMAFPIGKNTDTYFQYLSPNSLYSLMQEVLK